MPQRHDVRLDAMTREERQKLRKEYAGNPSIEATRIQVLLTAMDTLDVYSTSLSLKHSRLVSGLKKALDGWYDVGPDGLSLEGFVEEIEKLVEPE